MRNRTNARFSAARAALTIFVLLGCSQEKKANETSCTGSGSGAGAGAGAYTPRPQATQFADVWASSLWFGGVSVGATGTGTVTIGNGGNVSTSSFSIDALPPPFAYAGGSYPGKGGTCGTLIAPGDQCQLVVTFSPTATSTNTAEVVIHFMPPRYTDVPEGRAFLYLGGRARPEVYADLQAFADQDFGGVMVGTNAKLMITVSNLGNGATTSIAGDALQPPFAYDGGSFPGASGTCGSSLAAAASCTLAVTFSPTALGEFCSQLLLRYRPGPYMEDAEGNIHTTLCGTSVNVALTPTAHDFGSIPMFSTASAEFTLTNSTTSAIDVNCGAFSFLQNGPYIHPPSYEGFSLRGGTCCGTTGSLQLAPGNACMVVVEFTPRGPGQLDVQYDAALGYRNQPLAWSNSVTLTGKAR
jgi:hypothetical protein